MKFTGGSQIVAPGGELLNRAKDDLFIINIDPVKARNKAINPLNDLLSDRRSDCYDALF